MKFRKEMMLLYAVTAGNGETLYAKVKEALDGGVTMVQLREKDLSGEELLKEALSLKELCHEYGVPLIINDRYDIALKAGADGVHLGQSDADPAEVRKLAGEDLIIGVSAHSIAEAVKAKDDGADYLGAGALFQTSAKADARPLPMETFREICEAADLPVVAIGGVNKENIPLLKGSGAAGAAMISAIFGAEEVEAECRTLKTLLSETLNAAGEEGVNICGHTVKGAIFDFDGAIADSMPAWDAAGVEYLEAKGCTPYPGLSKKLFRMTLEQSADHFREYYDLIVTPEDIIEGIYSIMEMHYMTDVLPKPGAAELLDKLHKAGVRMCVATVTGRDLVKRTLEKWDMLKYFEHVFTSEELKCNKHTPVMYRAALDLLGTRKEETMVFEDALHAARTAKNDGFPVTGVMDPAEEHQEELKKISDIYITDLRELTEFTLNGSDGKNDPEGVLRKRV